ncbi:uncharacterized protein LOC112557955 [Pomacea canaliculata]|uniref:uncharacterized protein LOC112557955 n=1 Tax=Pomacea canaliculata TaxID=400727 RepID=UPI000D72EB76|nr:uncharacterized protein LOC112557955 [Pomacea canaliculata]
MSADYARRVGDVLYFYAPDPKPENGFTHLRFHVSGKSLGRFQRSELEALRSQVSRLLFVPPEFIFLSGVEPAQSITLTFMVHRNIEAPLPDLLKDHGDSFSSLGVDRVWFEDQEVRLTESLPIFMESKVEQKLCDLFNRNQKLEEEIVEKEVTLMQKQEELQSARVESARWQHRENYYRSLLVRAVGDERPDLATSRSDLATSRPDLATSRPELASSRPELASSRPDLASSRPDLASTSRPVPVSQDCDKHIIV